MVKKLYTSIRVISVSCKAYKNIGNIKGIMLGH